jgi:glycosyltransferase involved in cell wall biosynthesis
VLIERYLSREELDGLMWGLDCFVSLHRAEGFGLTMAETMGMGKAVVATNYSGNLTFMDETNSRLVKNTLVPIPPGHPPYPPTARWARPSVQHASLVMRRLLDNPGLVASLGEKARRTIELRHSPAAFGAVAAARIAEIRRESDSRGRNRTSAQS